MTDTPPDWVLLEAAKRSGWEGHFSHDRLQHFHGQTHTPFTALCDMILKHEQPPVDRKLLCAREACALIYKAMAEGYRSGRHDDNSAVIFAVRAIELYESGFGK